MSFLRAVAVGSLGIATLAIMPAHGEPNRVTFPNAIDELEHYTTVTRGETEDILTSRAAIDSVKAGQPMPNGTHVVIRFHRDGVVTRYFVMQKGEGWGADYPDGRTEDWQFQSYNADRTIKADENTARCQACHASRADNQFVFTFDALRAFD